MTGRRHLGTNVNLARQRRLLNRLENAAEIKLAVIDVNHQWIFRISTTTV
jgi:hypothetical protein